MFIEVLRKKCRKCKEHLETRAFYPDTLGAHGVATTCKNCLKGKGKTISTKQHDRKKPIVFTSKKKEKWGTT